MTKKHFIRAAEIVVEAGRINDTDADVLAKGFIELFRAYNDRFDTQRFLTACGLQEKD